MEALQDWAKKMSEYQLPRWDELPDIELYMDQVLEMMDRYLAPLFIDTDSKIITATMINNYVKLKMIPKPEKKRYKRKHIASILAITILKQILPISDISKGIFMQTASHGAQEAFDLFCEEQEQALHAICTQVLEGESVSLLEEKVVADRLILKMVTIAFASKIMTEKMLSLSNALEEEKIIEKK